MTLELVNRCIDVSFLAAIAVWITLFLRLLVGLARTNRRIITSSVKYVINTLPFLFVYAVYFSFAVVVRAPRGKTREDSIQMLRDWVGRESLEWILWALLLTGVLVFFNILYQRRIEKITSNRQVIILSGLGISIMIFGIFLGSLNAILGLAEIDRYVY